MPELPEVETIRRQLTREIKGLKINDVKVRWGKRLNCSGKDFGKWVKGSTIEKIDRRAKVLRFFLSNGRQFFVHLKMTGKLMVEPGDREPAKHTHVVFKLSDGRQLFWEDFRKFGFLRIFKEKEADKFLAKYNFGPEPLSKQFDKQAFAMCLKGRPNSKIKPLLLQQQCVAGLGNIYTDEALHRAKIHPLTQVKKLNEKEIAALHRSIVSVLKAAVKAGGTSSDNYLDAYGQPGRFVKSLKVYGRENKPCKNCAHPVKKIKVGGRGTHFCLACQKKK